jgi:hypothetical protein
MRAKIVIVSSEKNMTVIRDKNDGHMSVTNDAEGVVEDLMRINLIAPGDRLLCWDTDNVLGEILFNEDGFIGFKDIDLVAWAYDLYSRSGQVPVEELGHKLGLHFRRCEPCENEEPIYDGACLVCGTAQ